MSYNYPPKETPVLSDLGLIWDSQNSAWKVSSLNNILTLFAANLVLPDAGRPEANSQYSAPITGFTVAVTDNNEDTHLILTPAGTLATGTITLPASTSVRDKQTVLVSCTQIVTTLTVSGNGATVNGAPTTLAANGYFTLKYDISVNSWYRVG